MWVEHTLIFVVEWWYVLLHRIQQDLGLVLTLELRVGNASLFDCDIAACQSGMFTR